MIKFKILKKSKISRARLGLLETPHGIIETPSLVPVATKAVVKTLTGEEVTGTNTQILIANTFHLHLKPGEEIINLAGGLHSFMNWQRPLMTDSGGFQVFSLGFGRDYGVGKILKRFPRTNCETIGKEAKPQFLKITHDGVSFRSPLDGRPFFLGPTESLKIQEKLGADIIFVFDECTAPLVNFDYAKMALERTHRWARTCLENQKSKQALFGIIQGSKFEKLRKESAHLIGSLPFAGFGIGGEFGEDKKTMRAVLNWVIPELAENKPRHLLGIGYPIDMEIIIKNGIDLFDCTVPTHYARRGFAFTPEGKLDLNKSTYLKDKNPIDKRCKCFVCQAYRRYYLAHLIRAKEITGSKLLTFHNLYFFNQLVSQLREDIKKGKI